MTMPSAAATVQTSIVVEVGAERAFTAFFDEMAGWWDPDHHLVDGELAEMVVEPRVGGSIYDRSVDGSECRWATILAYEPPRRAVFSWNITTAWQVEPDPARASEVEVRFVPEGPGRTRVELEHRHLERHGAGWEGMRDAVGSPNGWSGGLERLASYLAGR
jgi:uncharacterized protein YndB with AHSA1/START domain